MAHGTLLPVQSAGQQRGCSTPLGPLTSVAAPLTRRRFSDPLPHGSYPVDREFNFKLDAMHTSVYIMSMCVYLYSISM